MWPVYYYLLQKNNFLATEALHSLPCGPWPIVNKNGADVNGSSSIEINMKRISTISRILLAFASLALIATYFVPVWRIDLFAPQYPEGLVMKIWLTRLTGDVDIINGLNHYIGMKTINGAMFPEFSYLIYIVGGYILFGLLIAFTGSRKLLVSYLLVSILGATLALYDFYQWGYDYGHNLNPEAPIKVPGLAYQPPVIGHKKLLNFDAYSLPDIGGWIVIVAVAIAFVVYFAERFAARSKQVKGSVQLAALLPLLFLISCNTSPEPIELGKDNCYTCKMSIMDPRFGAEIITAKGKVFKFDDIVCLLQFMHTGFIDKEEIAQYLVVNFESPNQLIPAISAIYISPAAVQTPMNGNVIAFANAASATAYKTVHQATLYAWPQITEMKIDHAP